MSFSSRSSSHNKTGPPGAKTGQDWKSMIYFDPHAETVTGEDYMISDEVLVGKMTQLVDASEKIETVSTYCGPLTNYQLTKAVFYHEYVVMKTYSYYWSIEKHSDVITIQRGKWEIAVRDRYRHNDRLRGIAGISLSKCCSGNKSIRDLIEWLYKNNELGKSYHFLESNCQGFAERVYKFLTE